MRHSGWQLIAFALVVSLGISSHGQAEKIAPMVLKGSVSIEDRRDGVIPIAYTGPVAARPGDGRVISEASGHGMAGVTVSVPQIGFATQTAPDGSFSLPDLPAQKLIVGFSRPGYIPQTVSLDRDWTRHRQKLQITLKEAQRALILDQEIRHLGDNSYAPNSAGAGRFRKGAEGIKLVRQFVTPPTDSPVVHLEIGTIMGLDTEAAHRLGQSSFHRTSTPMTVKVNGQILTYIAANGDGLRIPIPRQMLREGMLNTLELQTGYQSPDGVNVDFDDIELMLLTLHF